VPLDWERGVNWRGIGERRRVEFVFFGDEVSGEGIGVHISREHYLLGLGAPGMFSSEEEQGDDKEDGGKEEGS